MSISCDFTVVEISNFPISMLKSQKVSLVLCGMCLGLLVLAFMYNTVSIIAPWIAYLTQLLCSTKYLLFVVKRCSGSRRYPLSVDCQLIWFMLSVNVVSSFWLNLSLGCMTDCPKDSKSESLNMFYKDKLRASLLVIFVFGHWPSQSRQTCLIYYIKFHQVIL